VDALPIGTNLLARYRIERFVIERRGVALYEATDTVRGRDVAVRIIRPERMGPVDLAFDKFKLDAWEDSVVDYGNVGGVPFFVTTEWERTSRPPPLPKPRPRLPTIPIDIELIDDL
jgi:hypothetical protein